MENKKSDLKYTLLLGGGAVRGVAYCGAYKAIEEFNIKFDTIAGSSVGALVAGLIAIGYSSNEIQDIMMSVTYELFKDIQLAIGPQLALSKGEVFLDWIRELLEKKFYGEKYSKTKNKAVTFKDLDKNLVIITTDLSNFKCQEFSKAKTPDFEVATAIRISCGMPGLMKPIEYNNTVLVDGDLQKSAPMWSLTETLQPNDERTMEIRLEGDFHGNDHNIIEYLNAIYSYATSTGTNFLSELYGQRDDYDYIILDTGDLNIVDFNLSSEKRHALIESAYNQTVKYFKNDLKEKKNNLLKIYNNIKLHLQEFKKHINKNEILLAKCEIGILYADLAESIQLISEADKASLNNLKNTFCSSIKNPIIFGKPRLSNEKLVETTYTACEERITRKINEFEHYINSI